MNIKYTFPISMADSRSEMFDIYAATNTREYEAVGNLPIINMHHTIAVILSAVEDKLLKHGFSANSTDIGFKWHIFNSVNSLETSALIPLTQLVFIKESNNEYRITFDSDCLAPEELSSLKHAINSAAITEANGFSVSLFIEN